MRIMLINSQTTIYFFKLLKNGKKNQRKEKDH